jgi:RHS repeat-associated protein
MQDKSNYNLFYRICSSVLIILHLVTFGPIRDALAFSGQSASYKLTSGALTEGGKERAATSNKLWQDSLGEPCAGKSTSPSYILLAGYIPTIQSNPPEQTSIIPNQSWLEGLSKQDAFDLDDYFLRPDSLALSYSSSGTTNINVSIDPSTHKVSFSQAIGWFGTEKVRFTAQDTDGNSTISNEVTLLVQDVNNPPILDYIPDISAYENDLIQITPHAADPDGDNVTYSFTAPLDSTGKWQTNYSSAGTYTVTVTAQDTTGLTDSQTVIIHIMNVNRPPVLNPISPITANEGDLVTVTPIVSDPDGDAVTLYYSAPLDSSGKWLTDYDDAGTHTATITASDATDTVQQNVTITINNTNRSPQAILSLSKYTVNPNETINITLAASDPDNDSMTFSLKKDGEEIASGPISNNYTTTTSFTTSGDHTISATVTDAGGLVSTDTKGVDVVDPNANRDSINPVMGDFNGDALTDLGLHNADNGKWEICISNAGVFNNAVDWISGFGTSRDWWPIGGDFNGDGRTDAAVYNITNGQLQVALSSGSNFSASGTWLTASFASVSWQPFTGNFNADKYTDFALYNKDTGEVKIALGTGTGFGAFNTWVTSFGIDYIALSGDFNADSLSDLCLFKKSNGEFKVAFSNSESFVDGSSWLSGFATDKDALISDFNNDGMADAGYWDKSNYRWYYAISTGAGFVDKGTWLESFGTSLDESATTGDFNGDGVTDAATFDRDQIGINRWKTQLSTNKPTDLLTEIDNGIGGKTQVTYTYAAKSDNSGLPFPVYVASSISLINTFPADRAATYAQNFTFFGGYYDSTEREFRGFSKVRVTDPITNNYSETYFYQGSSGQDGALKGQIEKVLSFDGNARQISSTLNTYEVRKAGPEDKVLGAPFLKEQTTTIWEENATYITTKDIFTYDNIGNLLEQRNEGDILKSGDEKSTSTTYAQAYEVGFNRPLETALKDKDGNVVSKKTFEYDTKGNLTKDSVLISNPLTGEQANPQTQYTYDSFGNLTSTINALGNAVSTDYETDFYAYPQTITNSLGHTIHYVYEPKFGAVKSVTDANGATSSTSYDSLGRVERVTKDDGRGTQVTAVTYSYPDFNTKITTNAVGLSSTEYIDGLGRKYKTVSSGEDGNSARQVSGEVYYNNRGLVSSESLPHYINEDPAQISYVRYEYDIRGRIKKTTSDFPGTLKDAYATVNYLEPLYTETIDPEGNKKGARKDIFGNVLEVIEFTSGGVFHTYYEYDIQNNLIKTTDNQGNITQIFYDSLGRKIRMIDPDMGNWNYEYDLLGNLKKQTDAKGQVLTFEYDALNRLIKKARDDGRGTTDEVNYLYDEQGKENCLGRLSKVIDQSGSTEFFYDKLGREIKSIKGLSPQGTVPEFFVVERTYDILDRLKTLKYPDGEIVTYTYDNNSGLLEKAQGSATYVQDITYNAKGQINVMKYGNATQTNYSYGQDLRLSRILTQNASLTTLQDLNYVFDKNGNVTTLTDNLRSNIRSFVYDDLDRLIQAQNVPGPAGGYTTFNYQYDSIGNMTYKSDVGVMTYGQNAGPHALTSAGGYSYQYDANGNMISGRNKTLSYDAENRLLEVNESGIITSFLYDGDGGRVKKTTASGSTIYIGSLFEKDSDGTIRKHIFAGSNRVCTVTKDERKGTTDASYYHLDHLGSSNIITDANGQQVQYCEYTPYGTLARNEGSDLVKHKFTGKELDSTTGLYFYGARYYDPEIGRFITADTIVQAPYDPQSLNRYTYCRNNPINYADPTGHSWRKFWKKVTHFFEDFGNFISPFGRAIITGEWKSFGMIVASAAAAVLSFGIMAAITPMVMTAETAGVIAISAVETASVLDTKPGGWLINQVSTQIFDDAFGMRPGAARMWGSAFTYMAVNAGFQTLNANLLTGGEKVTSKPYTQGKDRALDVEVVKILKQGEGFNYGGSPWRPEQVSRVLFNKSGDLVGVASKSNILMLGAQHTGVVMSDIPSLTGRVQLKGIPGVDMYGLWGISHQAVNVSLLEAGYASTVMSVGGGWTTAVSTVIYGPYGGGAAGAAVVSQEK